MIFGRLIRFALYRGLRGFRLYPGNADTDHGYAHADPLTPCRRVGVVR